MDNNTNNDSIIIIGAGFAGLAAGIYARMNIFTLKVRMDAPSLYIQM
jgi:thioredoxin reductase